MYKSRLSRRKMSKSSVATDNQILQLHIAMAEKLLAEPWRVEAVRDKLEKRYQAGLIRHSGYIHWSSILDCIDQPDLFKQTLLDEGERMRKLRRRTILIGILSEAERNAIMSES